MELILRTDLEKSLPRMIEFNYDDLCAELDARLQKYKSLVVTEDGIRDAKTDRAAVNKLKTAFENSRKEVKAACLRPYDDFEKKVKTLTGMMDEAISNIDGQVKAFDEARKQEKRVKIEALYQENIGELDGLLPLERIWNAKWLNAGFQMKDIEETILLTVRRVKNDLGIIRAMRAGCETRMIDRYLQTLDMSAALAEKARHEQLQEQLERQKAADAPPETIVQKSAPPAPVRKTHIDDTEAVETLDFRVYVTPAQKAALRRFLIENKIKYGRVS